MRQGQALEDKAKYPDGCSQSTGGCRSPCREGNFRGIGVRGQPPLKLTDI